MPIALTAGRRRRRSASDDCVGRECAHCRELTRLRRDLHDGLGPSLAGILLRADLLAQLMTTTDVAARETLKDLRHEAAAFMAELRRVLAAREPAELDDRDLTAGLATLAERMSAASGNRLGVEVDVAGEVGALDRTIQVAAFWIVKEALTNVVKHAHATACAVRLRVDGGLRLSVVDNGSGGLTAASGVGGVGLTSMRDRAAELGGWCDIADTGGGVAVTAVLPEDTTQLPEGLARDDRAA